MEQRAGRVLVLDDAARGLHVLCRRFSDAGYVVLAGSPDASVGPVIDTFEPDVIVTRLDSTPTSTVAFLRHGLEIPVVVLASADAPTDARVAATRARADSIFTEPLDFDELLARVGVLMERRRSGLLDLENLTIDQDGHVIRRNGVELQLTATEYRLLLALAANVGQVLSKRQLLQRVWGFDEYDVNVVEVHISALRRKLEAEGPRLIQTIRGFGYVLRREDSAQRRTAARTVVNANSGFDSADADAVNGTSRRPSTVDEVGADPSRPRLPWPTPPRRPDSSPQEFTLLSQAMSPVIMPR